MTRKSNIDVFDYLDYRAFLRDFYTEGKTRRSLSFRAFSRRAGLKSTNYLKLVMDGDRNLAPNMAERFAAACGLEDEEKSYFVELVRFNQAQTSTHRNEAYTRLSGFRRYQKAHKLDLAHAAYHASWYIPAIRELAARSDFVADPARSFRRSASPRRSRRCTRSQTSGSWSRTTRDASCRRRRSSPPAPRSSEFTSRTTIG
jgi:uncharacterized protein (TIGR02147 family)